MRASEANAAPLGRADLAAGRQAAEEETSPLEHLRLPDEGEDEEDTPLLGAEQGAFAESIFPQQWTMLDRKHCIAMCDNMHAMLLEPAANDRECCVCGADIEEGTPAFACVPCESAYCYDCGLVESGDEEDEEEDEEDTPREYFPARCNNVMHLELAANDRACRWCWRGIEEGTPVFACVPCETIYCNDCFPVDEDTYSHCPLQL